MGKAKWTGRSRLYLIGPGEPGHNAIATVNAVPAPTGRYAWHAYHPEPETAPYAEGWADTLDEAKAAAEAAIRAHARRLLELVGEEPKPKTGPARLPPAESDRDPDPGMDPDAWR